MQCNDPGRVNKGKGSRVVNWLDCSTAIWDVDGDSCHSRCIGINKIYILNPTAVAKLLQYSGFRVEHGDGFFSYK